MFRSYYLHMFLCIYFGYHIPGFIKLVYFSYYNSNISREKIEIFIIGNVLIITMLKLYLNNLHDILAFCDK